MPILCCLTSGRWAYRLLLSQCQLSSTPVCFIGVDEQVWRSRPRLAKASIFLPCISLSTIDLTLNPIPDQASSWSTSHMLHLELVWKNETRCDHCNERFHCLITSQPTYFKWTSGVEVRHKEMSASGTITFVAVFDNAVLPRRVWIAGLFLDFMLMPSRRLGQQCETLDVLDTHPGEVPGGQYVVLLMQLLSRSFITQSHKSSPLTLRCDMT